MSHPHREFNDEHVALAYLITFRCYGTWLHGDNRGSVDRFHNRYGTPQLPPNKQRESYNRRTLRRPPVTLDVSRRKAVAAAIRETCHKRQWRLWALNVRTNHVHTVVSARCDPERILNSFKACATRKMRQAGCWKDSGTPWVEGGSKRRLWTEQDLMDAIDYVLYEQGEPLP